MGFGFLASFSYKRVSVSSILFVKNLDWLFGFFQIEAVVVRLFGHKGWQSPTLSISE